jgi:hypothetical protein
MAENKKEALQDVETVSDSHEPEKVLKADFDEVVNNCQKLAADNSKLLAENQKLVRAFNKLLKEFNDLHIAALLRDDQAEK